MVKISSQLYSLLFFVAISLLTIIIVQTFYSFIKNEVEVQLFIISIIIELIFVFVIIKVYDELGCKWENVKTIPLLTKKKKYLPTVQNNYYYNNDTMTQALVFALIVESHYLIVERIRIKKILRNFVEIAAIYFLQVFLVDINSILTNNPIENN